MGTVVALGAAHELDGFALVGAAVVAARSDSEVLSAWHALPDDVGLVVLTPDAARCLASHLGERPDVLTAVTP